MSQTSVAAPKATTVAQRMAAHLAILRLDHSVKQVFVLPGIVIAANIGRAPIDASFAARIVLGIAAATAVASSNYVLNELLDAPFDRLHPTKCNRPAASGIVHYPAAYLQWIVLALTGFLLAYAVSKALLISVLALWIMGCVYNIRPLRTKDIPYLDVLSESINNPLRFCIGWYAVTSDVLPPVSLLIAYWMLGCYFMALKRFSEYRQIGCDAAAGYRRSFVFYTEKSLLNSVSFYAATAMLFFGAFIMRYRIELVLAFPVIAILMAVYFDLAFEEDSAVQNPEKLLWEPRLMILVSVCMVTLIVLSSVDLPWMQQLFAKSVHR